MYSILPLLLSAAIVNTAPTNETYKELSTVEISVEEQRGIVDVLNPLNKNNHTQQTHTSDKKDENSGVLAPIQNLFEKVPQINLLNGSNPFEQLFSSQPGGNMLDNIKLFIVGSGGTVFPASSVFGGLQNFMQTFGNMAQGLQNALPSLPVGK